MKFRFGFVSNSSSTSFFITNLTNKRKTLVEFVLENPQLIELFRAEYTFDGSIESHCQGELLISAKENNFYIEAKETKRCVFGDEQGTLIGKIFDYILRYGGRSKSFKWEVDEYLR
jgi:hypothetical protein